MCSSLSLILQSYASTSRARIIPPMRRCCRRLCPFSRASGGRGDKGIAPLVTEQALYDPWLAEGAGGGIYCAPRSGALEAMSQQRLQRRRPVEYSEKPGRKGGCLANPIVFVPCLPNVGSSSCSFAWQERRFA